MITRLASLLESYIQRQMSLDAFYDQLSLRLQDLTESASEEEIEIVSEILAALYEVQDGMLDENAFRKALHELLAANAHPPTITVGDRSLTTLRDFPYETGTSTNDLTRELVFA